MMTTTEATARSAMKLALEAMENMSTALREDDVLGNDIDMLLDAITALREALTEQSNLKQVIELYDSPDQPAPVAKPHEQEPVAHQYQSKDGVWRDFISQSHYKATVEDGSWPIRALYTSPPPQQEPVAYQDTADKCRLETVPAKGGLLPQRTWVSLTAEQVIKTFNAICNGKPFNVERILELHRAIEAKLKEKNCG